MEIKLLHLYYDIMNLYGEYGNIRILQKHLEDQGANVIVDRKTINEAVNFEEYDFIYIGSGTERNQEVILEDIKRNHKEDFIKAVENNKIVLLTGNSYEILGKDIAGKDALGVLNFKTERTERRITADIIAKSKILKNKVVGFVNNMSRIKENDNPLFEIEFEEGESKESKNEGVTYKNVIGTHLIGPLLIRNPEILKMLVNKICKQKDENFEYKEIEYAEEEKAYELVLKELGQRGRSFLTHSSIYFHIQYN